ncbi:MAG: acyltransferase domain-containing protein [Halopseudomonas aestusnigri]
MTNLASLPVVFCFSGQGSQYYHMAAGLYRDEPVFRQWMQIGDDLVRAYSGVSVIDAIYDSERGIADSFDKLEETHPAIFLVQYALAKFLLHHGVQPTELMGVSLGEFTAMTLAEVVPFDQALEAICEQPDLFQRSCAPGGMIGVLGSSSLHKDLPGPSEVAGINADGHFVLSAPAEALDGIEEALLSRDVASQRLAVPYAFHSRWIEPAAGMAKCTFAIEKKLPRWPVWSSCTAAPVTNFTSNFAWQIVRSPMRVFETVQNIEAKGGAIYVDLSPSGTMAAIFPQIFGSASRSRALHILSPFGGLNKRLKTVLNLARNLR